MRRQLLTESMAGVLGLKNVKTKGSHATIKGELAEYDVHLGSAITT